MGCGGTNRIVLKGVHKPLNAQLKKTSDPDIDAVLKLLKNKRLLIYQVV